MKTMKVFLLAVLVTMTGVFTACSSDDTVTDTTENERGVVKTEFTISFPKKMVNGTRMAGATVQINPNQFRGITDMRLYPFRTEKSNGTITTTETLNKITLLDGTASNILSSGALYTGSNARLYQNVDIPIGTKTFLFYGLAAGGTDAAQHGKLVEPAASVASLSDIKFGPSPIVETPITTNSDKIVEYLNSIEDAKVLKTNSTTEYITWRETSNVALRDLHDAQFTKMNAGSWNSIKGLLQKMYTVLTTAVTSDNVETQSLKTAICDSIANATYGVTANEGVLTFENNYNNYPADNGLPDGAAYLTYDDTNKFQEVTNNNSLGINLASFTSYAYPASLYYTVLSGIRTSDKSESGLYTGSNAKNSWNDILDGYEESHLTKDANGKIAVTSQTRSIAITDPVQYAVARLDVTVKADGTSSSLQDSKGNAVTVSGTNFPVTGILVGGQRNVDFQFHQFTDANAGSEYIMYDNVIEGQESAGSKIYLTNTKSAAFSTLVLETLDAGQVPTESTTAAAKVQIAIEFQNNSGQDFYGLDGKVIYKGSKFYLTGTLDPSTNLTKRYNNATTGDYIRKAFAQDHTSLVNLTIKSLASAYNVLPDLSLPKLEMGLSVDLTWQDGITFDINIQ